MPRNMRPDNLGALVLARFALDFWAQNLGPLRPKMCANALQRIDKNGPELQKKRQHTISQFANHQYLVLDVFAWFRLNNESIGPVSSIPFHQDLELENTIPKLL
eukprot:scaffold12927_cov88-Cylindrotheca_fusiformis.AAC.2